MHDGSAQVRVNAASNEMERGGGLVSWSPAPSPAEPRPLRVRNQNQPHTDLTITELLEKIRIHQNKYKS